MFKKWRDLGLGVFMLAFSGFYIYNATQIKINAMIMGSHAGYANGRIVPYLLGGLLAILSLAMIVQGAKAAKNYSASGDAAVKNDTISVILTFFVIGAYIALLPTLGFILGTILFLIAQIYVLAPLETRNKQLWIYVVVALVFTVLIYVAFHMGLAQPLPRGIIENLLKLS